MNNLLYHILLFFLAEKFCCLEHHSIPSMKIAFETRLKLLWGIERVPRCHLKGNLYTSHPSSNPSDEKPFFCRAKDRTHIRRRNYKNPTWICIDWANRIYRSLSKNTNSWPPTLPPHGFLLLLRCEGCGWVSGWVGSLLSGIGLLKLDDLVHDDLGLVKLLCNLLHQSCRRTEMIKSG